MPRSGLIVSRATPMPDQRIKSATRRPVQPSSLAPVSFPMRQEASTAPVASTSLRLSAAVAESAAESIVFPRLRLNAAIQSLRRIDPASTSTRAGENSTGSGCKILDAEVLTSSAPTSRIIAATQSPERYSILWCPYGCSRSAGFSESLKPSSVTTELDASERLLNASAVIETLLQSVPTRSFPANSRILQKMPTHPASFPYCDRTAGFFVSA